MPKRKTPAHTFFQVSIRVNGDSRLETLDEREYQVSPCVVIKEGVLNEIFYPADEIGAFLVSWNGIPACVGHPMREGEYISANSPDVLDAEVYGRFFGASMNGNRLHGEIWLDTVKCARRGGVAQETRERLRDGIPTDLSAGVYLDLEEVPGIFEGEPYAGIARNIHPDHVALLPHDEGACNWEDGCGAPRTNQQQRPSPALAVDQQYGDGIMVALMLPAEMAQKVALTADVLPEGSEVLPPEELHITLAYLGTTTTVRSTMEEALTIVGALANRTGRIEGVVSGMGRFNQDVDGRQAIYASFDCPYLNDLRQQLVYMLWGNNIAVSTEHAFTPHITLAYIPADAPTPNVLPQRDELRFSQLTLSWGGQATAFQLQGTSDIPMLESKAAAVNTLRRFIHPNSVEEVRMNQDTPVVVEEEVETSPDTPAQEQPTANEELAAMINDTVSNAVTAAMAPFQEALTQIRSNADQEKQQLVEDLVANKSCAFSREDLMAMSTPTLRKLAQSLIDPDYSGQGFVPNGRVRDDEVEEVLEMPKIWG